MSLSESVIDISDPAAEREQLFRGKVRGLASERTTGLDTEQVNRDLMAIGNLAGALITDDSTHRVWMIDELLFHADGAFEFESDSSKIAARGLLALAQRLNTTTELAPVLE